MRSGKADRVGGLSFGVAVSAGLVSPILAAAGRLPLKTQLRGMVWAGGAAAAGGIVLASLAQQTMGESWRIGVDPAEQTALVTDGVIGTVRNPDSHRDDGGPGRHRGDGAAPSQFTNGCR
jgi:protein-S-isoprenylcysteine O-methyltransferase Ste14